MRHLLFSTLLLFIFGTRSLAQEVTSHELSSILNSSEPKKDARLLMVRAATSGQDDVLFALRNFQPLFCLKQISKIERVKQAHLLARIIVDESIVTPKEKSNFNFGDSAPEEYKHHKILEMSCNILNQPIPSSEGLLTSSKLKSLATQLSAVH